MSVTDTARRWSVTTSLPALPAAAGLCAGIYLWTLFDNLLLPLGALAAGVILLLYRIYATGSLIIAIAIGWGAAQLHSPQPAPGGLPYGRDLAVSGRIMRVIPKASRTLYILRVDSIAISADEYSRLAPFDIALSQNEMPGAICLGNTVRAQVRMYPLDQAAFPGAKEYYRNLGVSATATAWPDMIQVTERSLSFQGHWFRFRMKLSALLAESRLSAESFGLLNALLLGLGDDLPADYRDNFRLTGTAHVLALSGFHVGFIYAMISLLLLPLGLSLKLRNVRLIVALVSIWCFVFLTGMTLGVVRAALMLSVTVAGLITGGVTDGINSLCVAVALIACVWPFSIFLAGLQLSVCATAGIVAFNRIFRQQGLSQWRHWFLQLVVLPFGAVLATAPLLIYYFHSMPLLFVVSNFVAVMFIAPVIWIGVARLILSGFGIAALWLDKAIDTLTHIAGRIFEYIAAVPGANMGGVSLSAGQVVALISAVLLAMIVARAEKRRTALLIAVPMLLVLCATPLFADRRAESEAYIHRSGSVPTVIIRHHSRAAALVVCDDREYSRVASHISTSMHRNGIFLQVDTLIITRDDVTLGPFRRIGDSLYINEARYSIAGLSKSDFEKLY